MVPTGTILPKLPSLFSPKLALIPRCIARRIGFCFVPVVCCVSCRLIIDYVHGRSAVSVSDSKVLGGYCIRKQI